jgi:hypothetical protein
MNTGWHMELKPLGRARIVRGRIPLIKIDDYIFAEDSGLVDSIC